MARPTSFGGIAFVVRWRAKLRVSAHFQALKPHSFASQREPMRRQSANTLWRMVARQQREVLLGPKLDLHRVGAEHKRAGVQLCPNSTQ
jgi:hypothetical protein